MEKLVSVDLKAPMGLLKKPDINEGGGKQLYLTFNMLHKPALLGIFGAIVGFSGYDKPGEFPEYYLKLKELPVGIQPLNTDRGNFTKTIVQYNNSVGYASHEAGGNLVIAEQILIRPTFRCYVLLRTENELHRQLDAYLQQSKAEYIPYLGKNEFHLWWENYREYNFELFDYSRNYQIDTIFHKGDQLVKEMRKRSGNSSPFIFSSIPAGPEFLNFEELPIGFDQKLKQYQREMFTYTNYTFKKDYRLDGLFWLKEENVIIQLF